MWCSAVWCIVTLTLSLARWVVDGADWRSEPMRQARAFTNRLYELGKAYELIITQTTTACR